ncbi:syntaxin-7-like isoform X2 [Asterias rubens]|uniref:syntaxin-7-like isoform X2 n=1 Tax=Asterias rubens TaxID=7604 RepID=UPI00145554EA|nr:syntaxin-7-like isoform X2 [Asterias rubens]
MAAQRGRGDFGYGSLDASPDGQSQDQQFGSGQGNEFSDLSQQVSSALFKISNNVATLEKTVRQIGTPSDSVMLRNRIQASLQTTNKVVSDTTTYMKQLATMSRTMGKSSRLQVDRLSNEFHDSVQRYGSVQKKVASKMRSCPHIPSRPQRTDDLNHDDKASLMEDARRQEIQSQLQLQDQEIEYDMGQLEETEKQIRQIEASMLDVNEIFRDLSAMVSEQGEIVDSIEANIEHAGSNVKEANTQLQTASKYQKKARRTFGCIVICVVILAIVVAIILVVTLN